MSLFTTPFIGELISKNKWKVYKKFTYHVNKYPSKEVITIPKGFETDFASVPRIFWVIISPIDKHAKAAVVHDYCYFYALYNRKRCDEIFLEATKVLDVPKWKQYCLYYGVRIFSGFSWWRKRRMERKAIK